MEELHKLQEIFLNLPDVVMQVDRRGHLRCVNPIGKAVLGHDPEKITGGNVLRYVHREDKNLVKHFLADTYKGTACRREKIRLRCADGEYRWLEFMGNPIYGDGKITGAVLSGRDITEQKRVESTLRDRERAFFTLISNLPGMVYRCRLDEDWTMEYISEGCLEITGYRPSELEYNHTASFGELIHPGDRRFVEDRILDFVQKSEPFELQYRIITAGGEEKWVWEHGRAVKNKQGRVEALEGFIADVTERIHMEEALRQSEERYRGILASIEEGYYEVDLKGCYTFFNESLLRIFEYTPGALQGASYKEQAQAPEAVFRAFNRVYRTGVPEKGFVWKYATKDGQEKSVEVSVSLIKDGNHKPAGFRGVVRDVTERIRMEEALRQSEERYRGILASIEEGYYEVDLRGCFTFVNERLCSWIDYTVEELQGASYKKLMKDPDEVFGVYSRVLRTGEPERNFVHVVITKDGREIYVETSVSLIKDKDGNVVGFRGINRDTTERRRAELEIQLQKTHLEALFAYSTDAIVFFDLDERVVNVNRQFTKLFGYTPEEIKSKILGELIFTASKRAVAKRLNRKILSGESVEHESICCDRHGQPIEVVLKGVPVVVDKRVVGGYAIYADITARKDYERQLEYLSMHDSLTGAYNRAYFEQEGHRLDGGRDFPVSIIVVDIDDLKFINDTFGHSTGDALLKVCAKILKASVRRKDVVARIGGDEFVLLLPGTSPKMAHAITQRVNRNVERYKQENPNIPLHFSLGVATASLEGESLLEVFREADNDMYRNKLTGSSRSRDDIVNALQSTLAERDFMAGGHAERMSERAQAMGEKLGLSPRRLNDLVLLSRVHDLGKVGIPDHILFKPDKLNEKEWEEMRRHPEIGHRIAQSSADLKHLAELILCHHERWDGKGYPRGLRKEEIPIECRILAIVDTFDVLTNARPYRRALSVEEALQEIRRCAGTQFDPKLVELFLEIVASMKNESRIIHAPVPESTRKIPPAPS